MLREHYPEHGAAWYGWSELLPLRTANAILGHAYTLGVKCRRPHVPKSHGEVEYADENAEIAVKAIGEWGRLRLRLLFQRGENSQGYAKNDML